MEEALQNNGYEELLGQEPRYKNMSDAKQDALNHWVATGHLMSRRDQRKMRARLGERRESDAHER